VQTLPSDPQPAPEAHGLALAPFRGVRYAADRVSGIANVTSPPYDVIGPGTVERLLAAEPHNVVRLILPGAGSAQPAGGPEAGRLAARDLRDWLASGVLVRDPRPALYAYEQSLPAPGDGTPALPGWPGTSRWEAVQRGLVGALRLVPPGSPTVLPHEDVMPGPVRGRRELMEATQANLEPIFLLYDSAAGGGGAGGAARLLDQAAAGREPLLCGVTDDGMRHRVWALADPAEHAVIAADLAARSALIADGHHRYAAYREMQDRERASGRAAGPWDYGLAFLVDLAAYPPRIGRTAHPERLGSAGRRTGRDRGAGRRRRGGGGGPAGPRHRGDLQPGDGCGRPRGRRERRADAAQVDVVRPEAAYWAGDAVLRRVLTRGRAGCSATMAR